jgi:hypothetical protein
VTNARLIVVYASSNRDSMKVILGDILNPNVPLDRLDRSVHFGMFQRLVAAPERPGGIHRDRYEYRIGWGPAKKDWLLRYEFHENPAAEYEGQYLYANAHLHVNATAAEPRFLESLGERHFPTRKLWLEEILAGVCADVMLPRTRAKGKDEAPILAALDTIQRRISGIAGSV